MVTQCPICRQWFAIAREQADAAHGLARCGDCDTVFNALATLREHVPVIETPNAAPSEVAETESAMEGTGESSLPVIEENFERPKHEAQPLHRQWQWPWAVVAALALLALTAQLINANRYAIARLPVAGTALQTIYRGLGLSQQPRLRLDRYAISGAVLSSARDRAHALRLDARLINRASFPQRLPLIRLSLRDRHGGAIATRLLLPSDYSRARIGSLAAGASLRFHFELADPGAAATGFTLVLCRRRAHRVVCRLS
jgi:predicted Zn finger-like uncharacterized protein